MSLATLLRASYRKYICTQYEAADTGGPFCGTWTYIRSTPYLLDLAYSVHFRSPYVLRTEYIRPRKGGWILSKAGVALATEYPITE